MKKCKPDPVRGAIAGLAAGLAASYAMNQFQKLWSAASSEQESEGDPATVKAANKASRITTGHTLLERAKEPAGEAVHYGFGAILGIAYGIAAEYRPGVTAGFGAAFGAATAILFDDVAVPAAGLGDAPWKTSPVTHAYGLVSHLVFGTAAESTRLAVRAVA